MELIASRFGGHQNSGPAARSPFRRIIVGEDLEFLDRVDRRQNRNGSGRQLIVVVAVQQPIGAVGGGPAPRKRKRTARGPFTARPAIKEAVGIGLLSYTRR